MKIDLIRLKESKTRTLGIMLLLDENDNIIRNFMTLELPYLNNQKNISSIPLGTYTCSHRTSLKYGEHLLLENVPDRSMILIHAGNYVKDTSGCILVGTELNNINGEPEMEIINSKLALQRLIDLTKDEEKIPMRIRKAY